MGVTLRAEGDKQYNAAVENERVRLTSLLTFERMKHEFQRHNLGIDAATTNIPTGLLDDLLPQVDGLATTARILSYATNPKTERTFLKLFHGGDTGVSPREWDSYGRDEDRRKFQKLEQELRRQYEGYSEQHVLQAARANPTGKELDALLCYHAQLRNLTTYFFLLNQQKSFERVWQRFEERKQVLRSIEQFHPKMMKLLPLL